MNVYSNYLIVNGINLQNGDIVPYINISKYNPETSQKKKFAETMRHHNLWSQSQSNEKINILMYIKELNSNLFDEIFKMRFGEIPNSLSQIKYLSKCKKRRQVQSLETPVELIIYIFENNCENLSDVELTSYMNDFIQNISENF